MKLSSLPVLLLAAAVSVARGGLFAARGGRLVPDLEAAAPADVPTLGGDSVPASAAEWPTDPILRPNPLRASKTANDTASKSKSNVPPAVGAAAAKTDTEAKQPLDPIFVDWGKPKLALVFTGREDGYIEPCGCAGLDHMKGGLGRRDDFFRQRRAAGWPMVTMDVGGLTKGSGPEAEVKFQRTAEALRSVFHYDAIGLGASELKLRATEMFGAVASVPQDPSPFVSANVELLEPGLIERKRVVSAGGLKIGITSVLGPHFKREINNPDVKISDPVAALRSVLTEMQKQHCDLLILLAHASKKETTELAEKFPEFEIVVTAGGGDEPPLENKGPELINGRTRLIELGEKGKYVIVLGLFPDPKNPAGGLKVRYQPVPLDARFHATKEMKEQMQAYQDALKDLGLKSLVSVAPNPREKDWENHVGQGTVRGLGQVPRLPRRVVQSLEEERALQSLRDLDEGGPSAEFRPRMH